MKRYALIALAVLAPAAIMAGCSSEDDDDPPPPPPLPSISNINSCADPKSPVSTAIEINGTDFLSSPGTVRFVESTVPTDVVPSAAGWTEDSIIVTVPSGLTPGGTVTVYVITANGTSNGVDLDIVSVPPFSPSNLVWSNSNSDVPDYPEALRGLRAETVPYTDTQAYLYVSGGQTSGGTPTNRATVSFLTLTVSGATFSSSASWSSFGDLPSARAFHAMAAAHSGNSPVAAGSAYLYVIGGQNTATDTPGGTASVYSAAVNLSTGAIFGTWTSSTSSLPDAHIGHSAIVYRGRLFVMGGYLGSGNPRDTIYAADVNSDGTLTPFSLQARTMPQAMGSFAAFAFGGRIYTTGGENAASTDPNSSSDTNAIGECYMAQLVSGAIGTWSPVTALSKERMKHLVWNSFGQVIVAEGAYGGTSSELRGCNIQTDGTFGSWNGLNDIGAHVYNCGSAMSPISPTGGGPRFFVIAGADANTGVATADVWVNTAP